MASKTLLAFAGLAAAAANTAPNVPVQAQIGALQSGLTCNVPNYPDAKTFFSRFTATAPIQGASGQQVYFDDIIAEVTIPLSVVGPAKSLGGAKADATVFVNLAAENASPANFNVYPKGLFIDNITVTGQEPLKVRVPIKNTLDPIGPFTLGDAGKFMSLHYGYIEIDVNIYNKTSGQKFFGPWNITCPAPKINYALGIVNILAANSSAKPFKPTVNANYSFATIGNNTETGSFRFPYTCAFNNTGASDVDLTVTGAVPTYLNPGQVFNATNAYAFLRVPAAVANTLRKNAASAVTARTTVKTYTIGVINGSPSSYNAAGSAGLITTTTLPASGSSQDLGLAIPSDSKLVLGPFKAGSVGQSTFLTSGNAAGTIALLDKAGKQISSTTFSCNPKYSARLIGIPVTNETAPAISP